MTSRVFADGLRSVRLAMIFVLLSGGGVLVLAEQAWVARRISLERDALEEVRGGLGGQRLRDSAAWNRFEAERVQRIRGLEQSRRWMTWLLLPMLLATAYVARRLFKLNVESASRH
jgi:hypothetical protein